MKNNPNALAVKDLVTIGVFDVIYFVCVFAIGMMGVIPILYLVYPAVVALLCGPIVMLLMAKAPKPWALFIFGMIIPLIMLAFGHSFIVPLLSLLIILLAEGIRRLGRYRSMPLTMLSYVIFSTWTCNSLMQMLLVKERYLELTRAEMGNNYADALEKLITVPNMGLVYLGAILGGICGAFLGRKLLKKHFEKAGIL